MSMKMKKPKLPKPPKTPSYETKGETKSAPVEEEEDTSEGDARPLMLADFVGTFVGQDKFSDVVFIVGKEGKRFPGHRFILAASSPVFDVMLFPSNGESVKLPMEVKIPSVKPEVFEQLISCIYSDRAEIEAGNLNDLIAVAKRYQIEKLQVLCAEFLEGDVSAENACDLFQIAPDMLGDATFVLEYIRENTEEVLASPGFLNLTRDRLKALIEDDQLGIDEIEVFKAVQAWGKAEAKRQNLSDKPADMQKVLEDVLPLIRFPTMEVGEIAGVVSATQLLSQEQLLQLFQYVSISDEKAREAFSISFPSRPREGGTITKESKIVDKKHKKDLLRLFGDKVKKVDMKLLYRGSRDGFDAGSFHRQCDNKGATLTIIKARNVPNIFGGYAEGSWNQNGGYTTGEAWLFSLVNKHGKCVKFLPNNTTHGYCAGGYGPTWGGGHDLHINGSMTSNSNYSNPSTFTRSAPGFPSVSFDNSVLAGSYNFTVEEIEVFAVKVPKK